MNWISSTETEKWVSTNNYADQAGELLTIGEERGKSLFGFGSCISELGAKVISELDETKKQMIIDDFFGEGFGFDFCRLSVGANDFSESWYSYNELEGDYAMENFSVERDRKYIIPVIKEAQKRSEKLRFFASPWSPPTWMKFPKVMNHGRLVMTEENCKAYALYLKKYLQAYRAEGINITQLHVQNEIHADQKFPSCVWNGEDLSIFISEYLLDEIGDMAEVWYGTVN